MMGIREDTVRNRCCIVGECTKDSAQQDFRKSLFGSSGSFLSFFRLLVRDARLFPPHSLHLQCHQGIPGYAPARLLQSAFRDFLNR